MTTYPCVELPGLVGTEPLGFLAALGLAAQMPGRACLSWRRDTGHAVLHAYRVTSITDIVEVLLGRLQQVKRGWALPYTTGFPIPRRKGGPDPLRVPYDDYDDLREKANRNGTLSWLDATLTDRRVDADGYCAVTPYIAVRGRQTIGSFFYYPMLEVKRDPRPLLTEALTGWRRVEDAEGWLLDHRATYSQDPALRGPGGSMAVPGATWLATLALQDLPYHQQIVNAGDPDLPTLWHQMGGQQVMAWPLWTVPIDGSTRRAVWNVGWREGGWRIERGRGGSLRARLTPTHGVMAPDRADATVDLGVFKMCAAARPQDGPMPGPLTPVQTTTTFDLPEYTTYRRWTGDQLADI